MVRIAAVVSIFMVFNLYNNPAHPQPHSGENLYLLGNSARSLGRGGTGIAFFGTDLFYLNPATIALEERYGFSLNYGTLPFHTNYYNPDFSVSVPTSFGVFGSSLRIMEIPETVDFKRGYGLKIGGARDLTQNLMLGLSFDLFYGQTMSSIYYTGITLGTIYRINISTGDSGFGIYGPRAGFSYSLGIPGGNDKRYADLDSITGGYSFGFYKNSSLLITLFNEISIINNYSDFPVKIGLEGDIHRRYMVRAGTIVQDSYSYGSLNLGFGIKFNRENISGSVNYSITRHRELKFLHYLGLLIKYGTADREPPETKISVNHRHISPNNDGIRDYALFHISVRDRSKIKGWRLQIAGPGGRVYREYRVSERDIIRKMNISDFLKRLVSSRESMIVPEKILWDGKDNSGRPVPDGRYIFSFYAWDSRDNIAVVKKGSFFVDNTSPEVTITAVDSIFSPNGDKRKDELVLNQKITSSPEDIWSAGFRDEKGKTVRSFKWSGKNIPDAIRWDGKDNNGKDLPEGLYSYFIISRDSAGNKAEARFERISLTRKFETADIRLSRHFFSFKRESDIKLFPAVSDSSGLTEWKITIKNIDRREVKSITGMNRLPTHVSWNCRDEKNRKLPDGIYFIRLTTVFRSGNRPSSFEKKLIIDSTPPVLNIIHRPELFSPDSDGENDLLVIYPRYTENRSIKRWLISIFTSSGKLFKVFGKNGEIPDELIWNGKGDNNELVESAADYFIKLEAVDRAGNASESALDKLPVDILVLVTERGLKIRISNIQFGYKSSEIDKKGKRILDRVYEVLSKYQRYHILIEGHTDSRGDVDKNLILSENRAESVLNYLAEKGMDSRRMNFIGMGETTPLYPDISEENRRRNRRVEFLLIKDDKKGRVK